jgi:hypothetical protein
MQLATKPPRTRSHAASRAEHVADLPRYSYSGMVIMTSQLCDR